MNFTEIAPEFSQKFFELTNAAKRIVIAGHTSPDDDSISSALAVYEVLQQKQPGCDAHIIYSGVPVDRYRPIKNYGKIKFVDDLADHVQPDDTLIVVDGSQFYRFSLEPEKLQTIATTICIDHHASPIDSFTLSLVAPTYPAAAEVIYRALGQGLKVDKQVAEVFLLGILGDTGTFKYLKPNQSDTLTIAKDLIDAGQINIQDFWAQINYLLLREFEVLQEFVKNTHYGSVAGWPDFQYSFVTQAFAKSKNYTNEELSGGAGLYKNEYLRNIQGYSWGFTVRPESTAKNDNVCISMRSLPGSVNVRDMVERLQIGGGHDRAAGGTIKKNIDAEAAIQELLDWMNKNKPTLS